jgi:UDP:flavonoid glycosyltransferase YjiC (YdhE family)
VLGGEPCDEVLVFSAGGCTSSYEALSQGTPVVSTPTDALRGRFTYAMLRQFGLGNFIAPKLSMLAGVAVEVSQVLSWQYLGHVTG